MKVTARIVAGDKNRWCALIPHIDAARAFPTNEDGRQQADPSACFSELCRNSERGVQGVRADEPLLNCVVCEWLAYLDKWQDENEIGDDAAGVDKTVARCRRRYSREQVTFARAVWTRRGMTVRVEITCDGRDVVQKSRYERAYAALMAEAAHAVCETLIERHPQLSAEYGEECERLYGWLLDYRKQGEETRRRIETARTCQWRCNGYCRCPPPCKCANYYIGRCEPPKEDKE